MTEQNEIKPTKVAIYGDSIEAELAPAKTSSIKASFGAAALLLGIGMVAGLYTSSVSTSGPSARAVNLAEDDNSDNSTDLCGLRMGKAIQYFPGHAYVLTFGRTKYTAVDMFCPSYEGVWPNTVCQTDMIPVQSNYQSGTYTATSMGSQGGKVLQLHATDGHVFDSTWTVPILATGEDFSIASDYTPFFPYGASTYKIYSRESGECNHVENFFEARLKSLSGMIQRGDHTLSFKQVRQPQYSRLSRGWTATMPQPPQSWKTASSSGTTAPTPTRTWGPRSGTR